MIVVVKKGDFLVPQNSFDVSTATKGVGTTNNSEKTPQGLHKTKDVITAGFGEIIKGKMPTGKKAPSLDKESDEDYLTTRAILLNGQDSGNGNSADRGIFIHGTNEEQKLGTPASHGCVRMANKDVMTVASIIKKNPGMNVMIY